MPLFGSRVKSKGSTKGALQALYHHHTVRHDTVRSLSLRTTAHKHGELQLTCFCHLYLCEGITEGSYGLDVASLLVFLGV